MKGALCFECGKKAHHNHHVIPRSLGGKKTIPLCHKCHGLAHGKDGLRNTGELAKLALRKKRDAGERIGSVDFGFSLAGDGKTLIENEYEQGVIKEVLKLNEDGYSLRKICKHLTHLRFKPRGEKWNMETIRRVLIKNNRVPVPTME